MDPKETIRLTTDDLYTPRVEAFVEEQAVLGRALPDAPPRPLLARIVYSSSFYLAMAGMVGALTGWVILEPFFAAEERAGLGMEEDGVSFTALLLFPSVAGGVGLLLGAAEGIMCRNPARAATSALVGLGIGFVGALIATFFAGIVFITMSSLAVSVGPPGENGMPTGFGLLVFMMGRGGCWAVFGIPAGLGQGVALRNRHMAINGLVGGAMGGLLGGFLFDPIYLLSGAPEVATVSRGIGFALIGLLVGMFVGLVEGWTKTAWLLMQAGPLAGKQFVIFRNPTTIGSSPKCDVYVFKDPAIEPKHALIHDRGGRFEIEDQGTADGTYVNGRPVTRAYLNHGDQIVVGATMLEFSTRERSGSR